MSEKAHSPLEEFARWIIQTACWDGSRLDGGDIQEKAAELGLLTETRFDPKIHGNDFDDFAEPGDPWFVFSPLLAEREPTP